MLTDSLSWKNTFHASEMLPSVTEETEPVLKINTNLLKHEEVTKYKNRLIEDIKYEKVGSNGAFEANPKVVKIKGFELNKKIRMKISLTNKSKFSQRVSILPPTTPFFKIKYTRRGAIPQGLSETIILSFTPQTYCYYYDYIRIICEGDKLMIPIHAFPRMNVHLKEYVPKNIDFGNVPINTRQNKEIILKNIIDVGFEFEVIPISTCDEIKIEPMYGEIEPLWNKNITISFNPKSYGIFKSEYKFVMSEFDYQPVMVTIFGCCNVFDRVLNENIIKHMKKLKPGSEEKDHIKLMSLSTFNKNIQHVFNQSIIEPNLGNESGNIKSLEAYANRENEGQEESEQNDNNIPSQVKNSLSLSNTVVAKQKDLLEQSTLSMSSSPKGISKKFRNFPSNKEREFLNHFNTIDSIIKDKEIKYLRFIGKPLLKIDETKKIINERIKELENNLIIRRKLDLNRHQFELDTEKCVVNRKNKYFLKPTFDFNQNDKFFKARHYFNIFLQNMTKVVINSRADKRMKKLKDMISNNGIKSTKDFAEFVERDWLNFSANSSTESDNFSTKLQFLAPPMVHRGEVYMCYDFNLNLLKQEINHENNINLVDFKEFQNIERNDADIIGYKEFKSNGITLYEISTEDKVFRNCAENENSIRGERGDSELCLDKILGIIEMPENYKNHSNWKSETLLFNNPTLKKYAQFHTYYENAIDYNLQPIGGYHSPINNSKDPYDSKYSNDLYNRLPLSVFDNLPIKEMDNYSLIGDSSLDFLPKKLETPDERDLLVKKNEKIDEDNILYNINKEDDEKLRDNIEKDDDVIRNLKELNKDEIYDTVTREKVNLENNIQAQKRKWMSTVPTILDYYNTGINNPRNKFIL